MVEKRKSSLKWDFQAIHYELNINRIVIHKKNFALEKTSISHKKYRLSEICLFVF